jgi:hypothetical protein
MSCCFQPWPTSWHSGMLMKVIRTVITNSHDYNVQFWRSPHHTAPAQLKVLDTQLASQLPRLHTNGAPFLWQPGLTAAERHNSCCQRFVCTLAVTWPAAMSGNGRGPKSQQAARAPAGTRLEWRVPRQYVLTL